MEKLETSPINEKGIVIDRLIRILMSSNNFQENITDKMKPKEKKELLEKINKAQFNLTGWNDKAFKYALKLLLNNEGFSFKNLLKKNKSANQEDEKIQQKLLKFFSYFVQAKYYALALTLKEIVMKDKNEEENKNISEFLKNGNLIKLDISDEELNKIKLIEENFVLIENLMNELISENQLFDKCNSMILQKLGYNKNDFVLKLKKEMSKMIMNLDFKCDNYYRGPEITAYLVLRNMQFL
uniref:Uncharacterized protein n=1 Tax=Meloidogyne hapla TaxID=6305 RepID=A0A1I8BLG5_MELHA